MGLSLPLIEGCGPSPPRFPPSGNRWGRLGAGSGIGEMGRGPGAVTSAALPPARAWRRDAGSAVPEKRRCADGCPCGGAEWPGSPGLVPRKVSAAAGPSCRAHGALGRPGGCRCTSLAPFSARRRAPGRALPAGGAVPARGLAPHCGSGCGPGWARRGRVDHASSHYHPLFFSPPNARCHLFPACPLSTVPCQAGGAAPEDQAGLLVTAEGGGNRRRDPGVLLPRG